ncbi:thiosulfate sulfurtransferase GlpE [Aestuariirhabdus sp. Z084]|uniref:thiosulfate sulfurtransferase GlpE n=1 Tax=Aestuariirhabdus haliotis TaxID=2918751 RepID=UPI00201B3D8A|nr:thiosulfate sulfurtransferase GlpE [Aestuariirhabdus haliotis]MCL6417353.1 thiosulfate sulfurtransferase GlpE [Aestuariirhabdus haliotis]MCL6421298.1 thiosulfate sulfurtransferase GlpE [Aestuariirhabdus haliotis]
MSYQCISVEEAEALIRQGDVTLLDIRDPTSFAAGNIQNSVQVSNTNVGDILSTADKDKPVIIYCYHGNSSKGAAEYFYSMGFKESYSVDGGFEEWKLKL